MKVKQFATVVSGATPSKKHPEYYGGDIVWFTPKDLSDSGKKYMKRGQLSLTKDGFDSCSASMIPAHSVLMSSRAPIGLLTINETECCTNQGFKSIVPNQEICLTEYLYYYLKQNIKAVESLGSGTTFKEIDKASLEDMNIELPSIAEQHAVSAVLSVLDDAIDNNNSICSNLEATAKLLYDYWFVQFDFPDENGKPYKSSGGKMVWNDELKREIPAGWNVRQISDLVKIKKGISYKSSEITGGGTPMINLASFNLDGTYKPSGIKFFSGTVDVNRTVDACDLIMCVTQQTDIDLTGRTNVIGKAILTPDLFDGQVVISTDVVKLETETADIRFWLEGLFKQAYIHKYIVGYANGTKIKHLDVYEALNFFAACPPDDSHVLQRYSSIRATQMELYSTLQGEIESLIKTRDFLLPLLMNGQVTIGDDGE